MKYQVYTSLLIGWSSAASQKPCFKKIRGCDHVECDPDDWDNQKFLTSSPWNGPYDCAQKCADYESDGDFCTHFNDYDSEVSITCDLWKDCQARVSIV